MKSLRPHITCHSAPSFNSHTDTSLSSLEPPKLFAAPGAWPLFWSPECSDPRSPRGWFLLAAQVSSQNLHLLKACFLDQSSCQNPKPIVYFPFDSDCHPCLFTGLFVCPLPPGAEQPHQEAEASLASLPAMSALSMALAGAWSSWFLVLYLTPPHPLTPV